jgi:hypothetical protein
MFDIFSKRKRSRYFIFARQSAISSLRGRSNVFVQVEAFDKDHAISRLRDEFPFVESKDWDLLDEIDTQDASGNLHDIGAFGTKLPLIKATRH